MKIVVAKTAGFCMGVRRAVDMVLDAANTSDEPVFTFGPLIHNPQVLEMLREKGIHQIDEIPSKGHGVVLIRAHGVPPEDEKALEDAGFTVINATCPRVVRVQSIIHRYASKGYATIIIGDERHPEVVGLLGYAKGKGHTVSSMDSLISLPVFDNAVVVAQTTQDTDFYARVKHWCADHAPHYKIFDTICGSTEKRQAEIRQLAQENDAVVVVGGKQSGNTKRLAQIASQTGKPAIHIEDVSQMDYKMLRSARSVVITAGASTPNWIIAQACQQIESSLRKPHGFKKGLYLLRDFLMKTNIMAAAGAGSLTYACSVFQGISNHVHHALIAMLYVLSMHILNNLFTVKSDKYNHPRRADFYNKNKIYLWFLAAISGATGLYLSYTSGVLSFGILLIMSLLGLSYNLKIIPLVGKNGRTGRIQDISGSKTILITIAWGIVTTLLPAVENKCQLWPALVMFIFATGLVFSRTAFFDILAIQGDRITGKETLPILWGEKKSFSIIKAVLVFEICLILLIFFTDLLAKGVFLLAFIPFVMLLLIRFFEKDSHISGTRREFIIEFLFFASGCLAAVI
ncbi:MAG: 4-hydroxy-3-methylbut-2-enyl diphosphate reductase [Proteobacteria bacterium]|nr:4-hydroxy-3-methylbut-2-enyl diphosphate reductase [Pseudomonadota bacterium]MBU1389091.1 4-hydroxy-3-methylbut-2-enyl diphosphate reductase [Pseudomonadota bacterium]MBU1543644.1 4-hydroxy-3-methylbut-2-enyl diphosphate reductase [Pseudomonadota bacterium]MBU2479848.1 4-hydroxy-3-methylbut-2-enyl diphosphate reductase [Pseudomonadota bacterium]